MAAAALLVLLLLVKVRGKMKLTSTVKNFLRNYELNTLPPKGAAITSSFEALILSILVTEPALMTYGAPLVQSAA